MQRSSPVQHPFCETTVGQLVVDKPSRARVFDRLGIDYCCGGKQRLDDACRENQVDCAAVLAALEQDQTEPAGAERNWATASLTDLCDHIEQTHHAYLKDELPRLAMLTRKIAARHGEARPVLNNVRRVFAGLQEEMLLHMMKEERVLFPLCRQLDTDVLPVAHCGSIGNPIEVMIREHEHAGDAMAEIRKLTDNYTLPADACNTYRAAFDALQQLEQDLHLHVHKENNILFPKALKMEKLLATQARSKS